MSGILNEGKEDQEAKGSLNNYEMVAKLYRTLHSCILDIFVILN